MPEKPLHTAKARYGLYPWVGLVLPRLAIPVVAATVLVAFGFTTYLLVEPHIAAATRPTLRGGRFGAALHAC